MKYYSDYDIIMDDGVYKTKNGIVDMPHELPKQFKRVEIKNVTDTEIKLDYKKLAIDAGITGDELKKFMKKNTENKIKQLDSLEEA